MQVAILAGGLGTRLGHVTASIPKCLVPIAGMPFIDYQLRLLQRSGVTEAVLCIGHFGQQVRDFCGDGRQWGLTIRYSDEGPTLLGTAGALRQALPFLDERFFVTYGDSYLPIDFQVVMARFRRCAERAMMVVYKNEDRYDASNTIVVDGLVTVYDKKARLPGMVHIDAGVTVLMRDVVQEIPPGQVYPLEALFQRLVAERQMAAYETHQRFYEVGSLRGLDEFQRTIRSGAVQLCS